ncbi:MAG: YdcF family protein, partial [Bacteroidetes bacterium]|nr:YdcF family protein [Bacteroidota bacterium]
FLSKKSKRKRILRITAFSILLFFTNTVISSEFVRLWEVDGVEPKKMEKTYDCGILLGGMASYNTNLDRLVLGGHGDRIWQTLDLYHRKIITKILIAGDDGDLIDKGLNESEQMKKVLVSWGIPGKDIIVEGKSKNTHENALFAKEILDKSFPHLKKNLLITSAIHMKRSLGCFEKVGLTLSPYSTNHYTGKKRGYTFDQIFIPNSSNLDLWDLLIKEWVGFVIYDIVGYI